MGAVVERTCQLTSQNGQLTSRYADGTNNSYVLNIIEGDKIGVIAAEKADKSKWKPILHKIKL